MHEFLTQETAKSFNTNKHIRGLEILNNVEDDITITKVKITSKEGEEKIGKPIGNYITLEVPKIKEQDLVFHDKVSDRLSREIKELINIDKKGDILVIGLGNKDITSDSLGPMVVSKLTITRHILNYMPGLISKDVRPVCAVATGVLGTTGIETYEIVKGIVEKVCPKLVIVIDALSAREISRISTTIQISDTGITPGSGVGNKRKELSQNTLDVPVISIGVPTIIDRNTMIYDIFREVLEKTNQNVTEEEKEKIMSSLEGVSENNFMVTPKEIDIQIERVSKIIAKALNNALQDNVLQA